MMFSLFKRMARVPDKKQAAAPESAYHAVDIVSNGVCCKAVQHLAGTRFLSRERPPQLPLGNCDFPQACTCRYRHHEDRRRELRRHSDHAWGSAAPLPADRERRRASGRRASDR
jgi:hypothetical protein